MDSPRPHWAHHNHSDQRVNLIFAPSLWQPIVSSPPPSTNLNNNDDDNNNSHPTHCQHRSPSPSPPQPTSHNHTDSGYFTLPPSSSSSPRRPNQPLKVINATPTPPPPPPPHSQQTCPSLVEEEHHDSKTGNDISDVEKTRGEERRAVRWGFNKGEGGEMKGLVLRGDAAEEDGDGGAGGQEMGLRRGFEECLRSVVGDDKGVESKDEEGGKENLWARVKRVVGWRGGPARLKRAKVRFLLE